jgi:hypothetical protein
MSSEPAAGNTLINTVNANHSVGTHYARHERRASKVQCWERPDHGRQKEGQGEV